MTESAPPSAPPGELWAQILIAVQVLVLVIGVTFADDLLRGPGSAFARYNLQRVEAFAGEGDGGIVLIGNSTLKTAVRDWTELEDGSPQAPMLRLVDDHAFFDNFSALLPAVRRSNPRVVAIQAELLELHPNWRTGISRFRVAISSTLAGTDDIEAVQFGPVCPGGDAALELPTLSEADVAAMLEEHLGWLDGMTVRDASAAVPQEAQQTVRSLAGDGIEVVLLELPRAPELTEHEAAFLAGRREMLQDLAAESEHIHLMEAPVQPSALYCDLRHFNGRGQAAVEPWLAPRLAALR